MVEANAGWVDLPSIGLTANLAMFRKSGSLKHQ